jgi:hypothetical protein
VKNQDAFQDELQQIINRHSIDNELNTPDFILAELLTVQLLNMKRFNYTRDHWFGNSTIWSAQSLKLDPDNKAVK